MKKNTISLKFITVFTKTLLFTFLFSIIFVGTSWGQTTILSWDIPNGSASTYTNSAGTDNGSIATSLATGISGDKIYSGAVATTGNTSPASSWNKTFPLYTNVTDALTNGSTFYWNITIAKTATLTVNSLSINLVRTSSGPQSAELYYSTDNVNFTKFGTTFTVLATSSNAQTNFTNASGVTFGSTTANANTVIYWKLAVYGGTAPSRLGISNTGATASTDEVKLIGTSTPPLTPTFSVSTNALSFNTIQKSTNSTPLTFSVSGTYLNSCNLTLTPPNGLLLSTDGTNYSNSPIVFNIAGGTFTQTTIYSSVNIATLGTYSGTLSVTSNDGTATISNSSINCSATVLENLTPQTLPYYQDFNSLNGSSTTYPSGWQGWYINAAVPSAAGRTSSALSDMAIIGGTAASTANGIYDYNGKIGILSSGTTSTDYALGLAINTTGASNVGVSFDAMTIKNNSDGTSASNIEALVLQYRIGSSGAFTALAYNIEYQNINTAQTSGTNGQNIKVGLNAILPAACDNQPVVQLRWIIRNVTTGTITSRPSFAIDNVSVGLSTSSNLGSTAFLPGDAISIPYNANGVYNNGNIFTAQLSDATGYFGTPTNIGTITTTNSTTPISVTLPSVVANGTSYRIRVVSSNPVQIGSDNGTNLSILNLINYYYKGTGDLNSTSSWGTNSDGTGTAPSNFTDAAQIFNLTSNASTTSPWTVSGTGSKIVLGYPTIAPVSLTISDGNDINGTIDINASSSGGNTINVLSSVNSLTWGTLHANSEVHLKKSLTSNTSASFGKLFIENGSTATLTGTPTIKNNLTLNEDATIDTYGSFGKINIATGASVILNGTFKTQNSPGFTCSGCTATTGTGAGASLNFADATPNIQLGSNSYIKYNRTSSTQNIQNHAYANVEISGTTTGTKTLIASGGSTSSMFISGGLTISAGTLNLANLPVTFKASSTSSSYLNNQGSLTNATNVTIEKYLGNQRGWNILSLPFVTNTTLVNLATASNIDIDFIKPTVKTFNANNSWTAATSGDSWTSNNGIALFTKGIAGEGINGAYTSDPSNVKLVVTGTLNSSTLTPTTVNANTWTLVSNPYPAPISVSAILTNSNLAGATIAWYDSKANTTNVRVKGGGYYTATPSGNAGSASDIIIPSMGTFFINSTTAGTISMTTGSIYTGTYTNTGTLATNSVTDPGLDPDNCSINPPVLSGIDNPAVLRASNSITLSLTTPTTTGGTWTVSDNTIATINSTTGVVNGILPGTVSFTYSVTDNNGCTNNVSRTIIVQDATKPVISSNSSFTFCSGNSIVLTSTELSGNQWYKNGTAISDATSSTYTATTSGDYTIIVKFGTVTKTSDPVTLVVNTTPAAPTVSNSNICVGATVNLASATASNTLKWYTVATGGTALNAAPVSSTLVAGTYNYYVSNLSADGCESTRSSLTVTANTVPTAPAVSNLALCTGTTVSALTATLASGNTAKWFTVATGGTALSAAPTPSTTTIGTTSYYVSQISAAGCESTRSTLQVVVNTTPTAPTVSDRTLCINSTASALSTSVGTGNIAKWYTVATGGTALSATPVPSTTIAGSTDYYATQTTAAGCESPRAKLSVNVASTATPTVQNVNLCNNIAAVAISASKTDASYTLKWYSVATGGTALSAAPVPSTTTVGTVSYYATQVNPANTCESPRAKIDVVTNPIPTAAVISKTTDQKLSASSGSTFQWYKENVIINGATNALYTPTENGKYSIMISVNGCNSPMSETFEFINMLGKQDGNTINVGPNPFTNTIQLNYTIPSVRTLTVSVFSIANSKKVYEKANVLPTEQLQLSSLAPGIYIVQIVSDDNRIVEKYKLIKL
jgi:hypothetical protein